MADMGNLWEDYRKQARQLENEIDLKLVSFSKLGTNYSSQHDFSDTSPLLNKSGSEHMFETMAMEIEQLLTKLTEINDRMAEYTQNISMTSPSAALLHTLQRHRDILQDYTQEFHKTKANITAIRERDDLLGSVRRDISAYKNSSGLNRRTEMYLKEHEHIRNSERLVDDQISVAIATKESLESQKKSLSGISQKINTLANIDDERDNQPLQKLKQSARKYTKEYSDSWKKAGKGTDRFPLINSIVQRVNLRKRRDSIILASVIAICIILLLLYMFR